ncbi:MAG: hypothetical protein IJE91_00570 [Clostridia bacterium]|nr:hypothetical protein [Clostridia bacterium]
MRIWAKLVTESKTLKSTEIRVENYDYHIFEEYVREIAYKLDIPTPVVLDKHIIDFTVYKSTRFFTEDFVESVNFEKLVLENIG